MHNFQFFICSVLNVEGFQTLSGFHLAVAMADEAHGDKGEEDKQGGIGEQGLVAHIFQQPAGYNGGHDLGGHGEGVVQAGEFAHLAALAHFHNHRQGVDVDEGPCHAHQHEQHIQNGRKGIGEEGLEEGGTEVIGIE